MLSTSRIATDIQNSLETLRSLQAMISSVGYSAQNQQTVTNEFAFMNAVLGNDFGIPGENNHETRTIGRDPSKRTAA